MAVKKAEKLNMEPEVEVKETPAPIPETEKEAETPVEAKKMTLPKPSETKVGQWIKNHWKGFVIGAGAAIGAAVLAYAKGTSDAFASMDDEDPEDEEDIVDTEAEVIDEEAE